MSTHSRGDRHPMTFVSLFWWCNAWDLCFIFCKHEVYTLRNYFYIDMDPLHPMSFWQLLARLDMDIYPQNRLMGILRIHLKILFARVYNLCTCVYNLNIESHWLIKGASTPYKKFKENLNPKPSPGSHLNQIIIVKIWKVFQISWRYAGRLFQIEIKWCQRA